MTGYHPGPVPSSSSVRIITSPLAGRSPQRRAIGPGNVSSRRITAWIVRSIMLATTAFAIVDLSLLVSSLRH
ncbi:MAG TPA: hypothetical protein VK215_03320 [Acidimicrobiales bacterium]|nr:hypothetical protein [Acidimicrobiales bacterium]HLN41455.1 hypothetical protein [Acidimicrobiales bacterium]